MHWHHPLGSLNKQLPHTGTNVKSTLSDFLDAVIGMLNCDPTSSLQQKVNVNTVNGKVNLVL